jgi:hypothetical protein
MVRGTDLNPGPRKSKRIESACNAKYLRRLLVYGDLPLSRIIPHVAPQIPPKPKRFRVNEWASLRREAGANWTRDFDLPCPL